jgi:hypothetical protein
VLLNYSTDAMGEIDIRWSDIQIRRGDATPYARYNMFVQYDGDEYWTCANSGPLAKLIRDGITRDQVKRIHKFTKKTYKDNGGYRDCLCITGEAEAGAVHYGITLVKRDNDKDVSINTRKK